MTSHSARAMMRENSSCQSGQGSAGNLAVFDAHSQGSVIADCHSLTKFVIAEHETTMMLANAAS
jgi:hypothetical protein